MPTPTLQRTTASPRRRVQAGVISSTERGRITVLLGKLQRQWPTLKPWRQRHVTALLANQLTVYAPDPVV